MTANLICYQCKFEPDIGLYLDGVTAWWPKIDTLQHVCSACGSKEEIQISNAKISFGYLYGAGVAHFAAMEDIPVRGLEVEKSMDSFEIRLGGRIWKVLAAAV